ncbi:FAD-binding protein [Oryzobacter terrae]|uniref:FAD-binding protein n=1 Tax=Oryzobacter terrae TaxID=1620385 RepID=UPI0036718875
MPTPGTARREPSNAAGSTWAGSYSYAAERLVEPASIDELAEVVATTNRVRALGSRHSFTDVADTTGTLVGLDRLPTSIEVDARRSVVRVTGGVRYGELAAGLEAQGWALANLASLPHISVAGAVATGTHGSGVRNASLAAAVRALEVVRPDGTVHRLGPDDPDLAGSVVALGALGIVMGLELAVEPTYLVRTEVRTGLTWEVVEEQLDAVLSCGYSVSLFTRFDALEVDQLWVKSRADEPPLEEVWSTTAAVEPLHMLVGAPTEALTEQGGVPGAWLHRLPHFRLEFTPSRGAELQSEYFVPRGRAVEALTALRAVAPAFTQLLQVCEVRAVAGDTMWLSGAEGGDALALHFTWDLDVPAVRAVLPRVEEALAPFGVRPHWGKVFTMEGATVRDAFPRMADFVALRDRVDPDRRFDNAFLQRLLA